MVYLKSHWPFKNNSVFRTLRMTNCDRRLRLASMCIRMFRIDDAQSRSANCHMSLTASPGPADTRGTVNTDVTSPATASHPLLRQASLMESFSSAETTVLNKVDSACYKTSIYVHNTVNVSIVTQYRFSICRHARFLFLRSILNCQMY